MDLEDTKYFQCYGETFLRHEHNFFHPQELIRNEWHFTRKIIIQWDIKHETDFVVDLN